MDERFQVPEEIAVRVDAEAPDTDRAVPAAPGANADKSSGIASEPPSTPEPRANHDEATDAKAGGDRASGSEAPATDQPEDAVGKPEGGSDDQ